MSEQKSFKRIQSRNKSHGRVPIRDALPNVAEDDSPMTRSLDEILLVKPVPIVKKHAPKASKSLDTCLNNNESLHNCSSTDSFKSARSKPSITDLVPFENMDPSGCLLNPDVTNETLPSYDEDMFQLDTYVPDEKTNIVSSIVNDIVAAAVDEESSQLVMSQDSLELAAAITSAATSQAYIETLVDDSSVKIETLMRIRDEELLNNHCLKTRVHDLEQMKEQINVLTKDLENTYSETYAELKLTHEKEVEVMKLEATQQQIVLEKELQAVKTKLLSAEAEIVARESLEADLNRKIFHTEAVLRDKEKRCKDELQGVIAKLMRSEIITSAKTEVEEELATEKKKEGNVTTKAENIELLAESHRVSFSTPPKSHRLRVATKRNQTPDLESTIKELKKLCEDKQLELAKIQSESEKLKGFFLAENESLKTELDRVNSERDNLLAEQESHKNAFSALCNEHTKELEKLREEKKSFQESTKKIKTDLQENIIKLNAITCERDQLFQEQRKAYQDSNTRILALQAKNADLNNVLDDINEKMKAILNEKDNFLSKNMALEAALAELRIERDLLASKNNALMLKFNLSLNERLSLDRDLETLRRFGSSSDAQEFNWSKATEYMEFIPNQAEEVKRRMSIEKDLENCWTERCEVEQQLAAALAENAILRQRVVALDTASRRASGLIEADPTAAAWVQLRSCIREIVNELSVLCDTEKSGRETFSANRHKLSASNDISFLPIERREIQERSSPEGGRGTTPTNDSVHEPDYFYYESKLDENLPAQDVLLDQSSNALMEMVEDLIRCFNGEEFLGDANCTFNSSLNGSISERLSTIPEAGELCRVLQQIKEEVSRLFAISKRPDPSAAKLQEELHSLQQQVIVSDKKLRSMRAFLEEQAAERETERDDASKRIEELAEVIRSKERQLAAKQLHEQDIEALEQQLAESQGTVKEELEKRTAAEEKLQQTSQKVGHLRDILENLELQLAEKCEQLEASKLEIIRLQDNLVQSGQHSLEVENAQRDFFSETLAYTARLEEELTSLRYKLEAVGPESLANARTAIKEMEAAVAQSTKVLELAQVAWSGGLSSASEEISTRDHVDETRCVTPDEMALEASTGLCEDVERLRERLRKHARVEEAALKKIKDLEQIGMKKEELQVDFEVAMRRMDCLMTENGLLKTRIEEEWHKHLEKVVPVDLEAKIHELESKLEAVREESLEDKTKLMEKCRREERLQASLEACEADLSAETITVQQLKERLKHERSLRLAAEASLHEISNKENMTKTDDSNASSAKRVRFWAPHSFVGDSLTPISHNDGSVLRDAESVRQAIHFDTLPHKLPWSNSSSVAALQLSPRGVSTIQDPSNINLSIPVLSPIQQETNNEISFLKSAEKSQNERIKRLEEELKTCQKKISRDNKEMELTKKIAEDALARVRVQAESAHKELEIRKDELSKVNSCLKDVALESEIDKELGYKLLSQLQEQLASITDQLNSQQKETNVLKTMLEKAKNELDFVKTDRDVLGRREKQLSLEKENLDSKIMELEAQRHVQQITQAECEKLKIEKELISTQLSIRMEEFESVKLDLQMREEEILKLKNEKDEIELKVQASCLKIEELVEINGRVGLQLKELDAEMASLKAHSEVQEKKIEALNAENNSLRDACKVRFEESSTFEDDADNKARLEKLHMDAASLRACLKSSLSRSASLEAEIIMVRSHLEDRELKVTSLETELKDMRLKFAGMGREQNDEKMENVESLRDEETELMIMKLRAEEFAMRLEKKEADLARARSKETRLRSTLDKAVELGREGASRETNLQKELSTAEREIVRLKYLLDTQSVASRGLEKLHHHGLAAQRFHPHGYDPRSVRSAGDGEDKQAEWRWTVHRLESYRKALIWQKTYLQKNGNRVEPQRHRYQKTSFRVVGLMVVAILRMRYLTRRWKSRLPPLISPPRRGERRLMLNSPPCKDPGFRAQPI